VVSLTFAAVIAAVALLSPLIVRLARLPVPEIVLQIVLGITIGPQVLDWADVDASVRVPSLLGWAFPLLLSGIEIDFDRLRSTSPTGTPCRCA
jgi:Kef-type K+ transport system membrane component KefB